MVFATFFFRALCDVTSFIVGPTQLLRGGPETPTGVFLFFPRVMNMNDWRGMKTSTGACRAAPRTCLNQSCLPAVLLQSHASQFVLRDLATLVLKNSRATPGPEQARGGSARGPGWVCPGFSRSRKAPAPRVWLKSEKLQWGTAATSQNGRGAKSDYNAAGLPRAPRFTLKRPWLQGSHTAGLCLGVRTRLIVL